MSFRSLRSVAAAMLLLLGPVCSAYAQTPITSKLMALSAGCQEAAAVENLQAAASGPTAYCLGVIEGVVGSVGKDSAGVSSPLVCLPPSERSGLIAAAVVLRWLDAHKADWPRLTPGAAARLALQDGYPCP